MKNNRVTKTVILLIVTVLLAVTLLMGWGGDKIGYVKNIRLGLDLAGGVSITYQAKEDASSSEMNEAVDKMQLRVESQNGADVSVYREGDNRITVEIPDVTDADAVLEEIGTPGELYFIRQYGSDGKANYKYDTDKNGVTGWHLTKTIDEIKKDGCVILTGAEISSSSAGYIDDSKGGKEAVVKFALNSTGTSAFATATKEAKPKNESIAIYYDGDLISVPTVESEISTGEGVINGMDSMSEAKKLASYISIGSLPVSLEEVRSDVVAASLGHEAIKTSLIAGAVGFVLLIIFMIVFYRIPGFAASFSLGIYTMIVLFLFSIFGDSGLSLTLPGIAGVLLSIGMAVDANVIIFARIREELAIGKSVESSIKTGFSKALSAIIDGNITTLIASIVLIALGSGAVKGFAYTLALGIIVSMFTALFVTKFILRLLVSFGFNDIKYFGVQRQRKTVNFLSKKHILLSISAAIIVIGFVTMGVQKANDNGILNYDLEFSGGASTSVTFNQQYTQTQVDNDIIPVIKEATGVQTVQQQIVKNSNTVVFKTVALSEEQRQKLVDKLTEKFNITDKDIESQSISSTISSEMRRNSIKSVLIATVCMLLYIWIRFRNIRFATSAIAALIHDILIVLTFYAVSRIAVGNTFIACMLTILGYSINATIVIFDRIRENLKTPSKYEDLADVVNVSITQTLSRSINTSLTTFIMIAMLFVFGVSSIRYFAAPLMVGIVAGGYSSVCITGALWYIMSRKQDFGFKKKKKGKN